MRPYIPLRDRRVTAVTELRLQAADHWQHALAGTLKDEALLTLGTQAAVWIATTCVRVADSCFSLAGGSAVYETSPLQRRLRDLHVAAQHAAAQQRQYVGMGKLLLGRPAPQDSHDHETLG